MTLEERKQIRDRKLGDYYDARDERQALCGKVSDYINTLRSVIKAYDQGELRVTSSNWKIIQIPTQTELEDALMKCEEARNAEKRLYNEAIESGVNSSRMPSKPFD